VLSTLSGCWCCPQWELGRICPRLLKRLDLHVSTFLVIRPFLHCVYVPCTYVWRGAICGLVFCYMFTNHFVTSTLTFCYWMNRYFLDWWLLPSFVLCYVTKLSSWLYFQMYKITRFFCSFKCLSVIQSLLLTSESFTSPLDSKFNRVLNCLVSLLNFCRPFFLMFVISNLYSRTFIESAILFSRAICISILMTVFHYFLLRFLFHASIMGSFAFIKLTFPSSYFASALPRHSVLNPQIVQ
jgi:hypothetical protein